MVLEEMIQVLHDRTKIFNNDSMLIRELNSALDYVWQRLYQVFPSVKVTFETTGTFSVDTQDFDLATEITSAGGVFYGSKTFFLKATSQDNYIPVVFMDSNDMRFQARDQLTAQLIQPTYAYLNNFNQIRFAPTVPSTTLWRSDWIGKPPNLSLATNANASTSIPEPLHQAVTDKATSTVFNILDDDREERWNGEAENKIGSAIHVIKRRQFQTPQTTTPYPGSTNWRAGWSGPR